MNTKLTFTIDKDLVERAEDYAKSENRSLSQIIESYLRTLTQKDTKIAKNKLHPLVASLKGSFKIPKNMDYKKELRSRLEEKYL